MTDVAPAASSAANPGPDLSAPLSLGQQALWQLLENRLGSRSRLFVYGPAGAGKTFVLERFLAVHGAYAAAVIEGQVEDVQGKGLIVVLSNEPPAHPEQWDAIVVLEERKLENRKLEERKQK